VTALDPLLTSREVAERFGVQVETVWNWRRVGRIEAIRTPGGRLRYTEQAIETARNALERDGTDGNDHAGGRATPAEPAGADDAPTPRVAPCPNDTNGDGGCGRRLCPHCGPDRHLLAAPMAGRDFDIDGQPWG
jgi:helix-turn-helix protein